MSLDKSKSVVMKKIENYDGPRDENGIVDYVLKKYESYLYVKEPPQIVNQNVLNDECIYRKREPAFFH